MSATRPEGHAWHEAREGAELALTLVPTGQLMGDDAPKWQYAPGGQVEQTVEPGADANFPAAQGTQTEMEVAPTVFDAVPTEQLWHDWPKR